MMYAITARQPISAAVRATIAAIVAATISQTVVRVGRLMPLAVITYIVNAYDIAVIGSNFHSFRNDCTR